VRLVFFHRLFSEGNKVGRDGWYAHGFAVLLYAGVFQGFRLLLH
jgi:hypothetical protein